LIGSFAASIAPSSASRGRPGASSEAPRTAGSRSLRSRPGDVAAFVDPADRDRDRGRVAGPVAWGLRTRRFRGSAGASPGRLAARRLALRTRPGKTAHDLLAGVALGRRLGSLRDRLSALLSVLLCGVLRGLLGCLAGTLWMPFVAVLSSGAEARLVSVHRASFRSVQVFRRLSAVAQSIATPLT
jgi:hypothetical protein